MHAGVHAQPDLNFSCQRGINNCFNLRLVFDHQPEVILSCERHFITAKYTFQQQYRLGNAVVPQINRFFNTGDTKGRRNGCQRSGYFNCAMTIGIGFHHGNGA